MAAIRLARALALAMMLAPGAALAQDLPIDTPVTVGGVETVCTGIGLDARSDPRWAAYSLKIEIAGPGGGYLADEQVILHKDGRPLLTAACGAPWLLFRLAPGLYEVEAVIGGETVKSAAFVPAQGQGRIILRFSGS